VIEHRDAGEAGFVQRDRALNVDLDGLTILLELPGPRIVLQPSTAPSSLLTVALFRPSEALPRRSPFVANVRK